MIPRCPYDIVGLACPLHDHEMVFPSSLDSEMLALATKGRHYGMRIYPMTTPRDLRPERRRQLLQFCGMMEKEALDREAEMSTEIDRVLTRLGLRRRAPNLRIVPKGDA